MITNEKNWYAVYTKSRNEKKLAMLLKDKGIEFYLPLVKKLKQWSDRRKWVEVPLFNSYIFVHISELEYYRVLGIPGVVRFVSFEGIKTKIRDIEIEAIKKYVETGEEILDNEEDFIPGKSVKVVRGQFKDLHGKLVQILGKQRVKIEIEAVGKSVFLRIPMGSLVVI
jgi:transcriptional antiterminator RfaH